MSAKKDGKVVKEIIARYGETLDLKRSPYLIVEIIRQYSGKLGGIAAADCLPPGGPPKRFDEVELAAELKARIADIVDLSEMLVKATKKSAKASAKTKTSK